eukprot:CAMPEP_0117560122 /NCGR_PEP_ID=MMETSP0784-20121206/53713_1 /TAXON_ID=39447 /ORGANISM="" /LENGTH=157 /DNA_ID=CAMNT_0005357521 /DNA_START=433 /DNA_END=902 /DNA_ORIENTATION=-
MKPQRWSAPRHRDSYDWLVIGGLTELEVPADGLGHVSTRTSGIGRSPNHLCSRSSSVRICKGQNTSVGGPHCHRKGDLRNARRLWARPLPDEMGWPSTSKSLVPASRRRSNGPRASGMLPRCNLDSWSNRTHHCTSAQGPFSRRRSRCPPASGMLPR